MRIKVRDFSVGLIFFTSTFAIGVPSPSQIVRLIRVNASSDMKSTSALLTLPYQISTKDSTDKELFSGNLAYEGGVYIASKTSYEPNKEFGSVEAADRYAETFCSQYLKEQKRWFEGKSKQVTPVINYQRGQTLVSVELPALPVPVLPDRLSYNLGLVDPITGKIVRYIGRHLSCK